ncbi:MAG: LapA family protein [Rhodothermales bacterium]
MRIAIILSLIISALAIIFAAINPLAVDIYFGFFTIESASLPLVLITTLIIGVFVGYLMWLPARMRLSKKVRALERSAPQTVTIDPVEGDGEASEMGPDDKTLP